MKMNWQGICGSSDTCTESDFFTLRKTDLAIDLERPNLNYWVKGYSLVINSF